MWYTEGNGTGLYYSFRQNGNDDFGKRELVSRDGRHPQLSANGARLIMVWEEILEGNLNKSTSIICQISINNKVSRRSISTGDTNAYSPVVTKTQDGFLVAFLMDTEAGARVFRARL